MILQSLGLLVLYIVLHRVGAASLAVRVWCLVWGTSSVGGILLEDRAWWIVSPSMLFLFALTLALGLGTLAASPLLSASATRVKIASEFNFGLSVRHHRWMLLACLAPGYLSVHLLLGELGQDYGLFLSAERLVASAAAASFARYNDGFDPAPVTRALVTFVYLGAMLAGSLACRTGAIGRWWLLLASFVPALAWATLLTTKANFLFWLVYALAGYLAFKPTDATSRPRHWRLVAAAALLAMAVLLLMIVTQANRAGGFDVIDMGHLIDVLAVAAVGHVFALREWFDHAASAIPLTFGARNFAGVVEVLGLGQREPGLYGDDNVFVGGSFTNVYSVLRAVVEDLGAPLSVAAFALLGAFGALAEGSRKPASRAALAVLLAWLLFSPITSIFAYNSLLLACLLFVAMAAVGWIPTKRTTWHASN